MRLLPDNSRTRRVVDQARLVSTESTEPEEWSTLDCLRILYRRRATLAWITAAGFAVAVALCIAQPRYFQSAALLEVQGINENFLNLRDIYQTVSPSADSAGVYIQTQVEILQQDALIDLVAKRLRLDQRPEFGGRGAFWIDPPQGSLRHPVAAGQNIVAWVKQHLAISPIRNTRIIEIACTARDRQLAADIANTLAEVFIVERADERRREAQRTYESLKLPVEELRRHIAGSEAEFTDYRSSLGVEPVRGTDAIAAGRGTFKSEMDANLRFYEGMVQRLNDAGIASTVLQSNIRLVSKARPAESPYRPNVPLNIAVGTLGGLLLGAGWAMLREQTHSVLRTPAEAGRYLTVPELGAIPRFTDQAHRTTVMSHLGRQGPSDDAAEPKPRRLSLPESFRAALASILSSGDRNAHPRSIVITSSVAGEGKTTVVSNLGIALTEISGKVLLIDGDMRRPRLHQVFQQCNSWGLSDVLLEKNAVEDLPAEALVKRTAIPRLSILTSGPCTDKIFGLLYSERLSRLLSRFREEFDYVLIDAPPSLEFADARIMARYTDGLLLVVRANWTPRQTAQTAVRRLLMDRIPLIGAILNHCDPEQSDLYGYAL
jgi:polysaccharide biosynthesis transport protein